MRAFPSNIIDYSENLHAVCVLKLVNADRLPGQPACTLDMLRLAEKGESEVDGGWWAHLRTPKIKILTREAEPIGVISYADHQTEDSVYLLWLHGSENQAVISQLLEHFLADTRMSTIHAFHIATALTSGLEALPIGARRVTHNALIDRRFIAQDLWRYMRMQPSPGRFCLDEQVTIAEDQAVRGWHFSILENAREIGFVSAGALFPGIGVIWLIEVEKEHRRRGLGRKLLETAMAKLIAEGATEIILYVDDDDKAEGSERNKTAANTLYDSIGFEEIDRLYSYDLKR